MTTPGALALALPWWVAAVTFLARFRRTASIDSFPAAPLDPALRLSVIVPARNEARVITRCVRSILDGGYPDLELIVVDDDSHDGTAQLARDAAAGDPRFRVVPAPPLPPGWFGKQWACWHGAQAAGGEVLLFTDADTAHGPELHARTVRAMQELDLDLASVIAHQELGSFWERVVQPQVFAILFARYGGAGVINRSRRVASKIAAGQCIAIRRTAYDATGGHEAVRGHAAEDLALAQRFFALGHRTWLASGVRHLTVRMYTSLAGIVQGWTKNVFAAGRDAVPFRMGRGFALAVALPLPPLLTLLPLVALAAAVTGVATPAAGLFGVVSGGAVTLWFAAIYRDIGLSRWWMLTAPLGAVVVLGICLAAIARGSRVRWKDRSYVAAR